MHNVKIPVGILHIQIVCIPMGASTLAAYSVCRVVALCRLWTRRCTCLRSCPGTRRARMCTMTSSAPPTPKPASKPGMPGYQYPRPRGRARKDHYWNADHGKWMPDPTIPRPKFRPPRGQPPPGKYWHTNYGVWLWKPGERKRTQKRRGSARPFVQFCTLARSAYRDLNKPHTQAFCNLSFPSQMKQLAKTWQSCKHSPLDQ